MDRALALPSLVPPRVVLVSLLVGLLSSSNAVERLPGADVPDSR